MTTEIIIGLIGICLIILGYFIADIKKYIKEWIRRKRGLCIGCGAPSKTGDWSIIGISTESNKIRCDLCGRVQMKPKGGEKENG